MNASDSTGRTNPLPILGVDGGGSKTRAIVVEGQNRVLWRGEGGPGNCRTQPIAKVFEVLDALHHRAIGEVGALAGAGIGLAGAGDAATAAQLGVRCARAWQLPESAVLVNSDLRMSHRAAFSDGPGILLISGTGSSCLGCTDDDRWHQCGGWGPVLDDQGSGYQVGLEALRCILRGHDGRDPVPAWGGRLLEVLGLQHPGDLVGWVHSEGDRRPAIADLCETIIDQAEAGDGLAQKIRARATKDLCDLVVTTAQTLKMDRPDVVIHGGLGTRLRPLLDAHLMDALHARVVEPVHPPEWGGIVAVRSALTRWSGKSA